MNGLNNINNSGRYTDKATMSNTTPVSGEQHPTSVTGINRNDRESNDYSIRENRLATFKTRPHNVMGNLNFLAKQGQILLPNEDRTQCFSCRNIVTWIGEYKPASHPVHNINCAFNIEMMMRNSERLGLRPSAHQYNRPSPHNVGPNSSNEPHTVNREDRPSTLRGFEDSNNKQQRLTLQDIPVPEPSAQKREELQKKYPCLNPLHPHMRNTDMRLETYQYSTRWPNHINATPKDLADAGLLFRGPEDRTICWYCYTGLKAWDRDDNPWKIHAQMSPACEYILQQKGPEFIDAIAALNPTLAKLRYKAHYKAHLRHQLEQSRQNDQSADAGNSLDGFCSLRKNVEPKEEVEKIEAEVDKIMTSHTSRALIGIAKEKGFSDNSIKIAFRQQYQNHQQAFDDQINLLDALQKIDKELERYSSLGGIEKSKLQPEEGSLAMLQSLINEKSCRLCHQSEANIAFMPCGHLTFCKKCAPKMTVCHFYGCRQPIAKKIEIYTD